MTLADISLNTWSNAKPGHYYKSMVNTIIIYHWTHGHYSMYLPLSYHCRSLIIETRYSMYFLMAWFSKTNLRWSSLKSWTTCWWSPSVGASLHLLSSTFGRLGTHRSSCRWVKHWYCFKPPIDHLEALAGNRTRRTGARSDPWPSLAKIRKICGSLWDNTW